VGKDPEAEKGPEAGKDPEVADDCHGIKDKALEYVASVPMLKMLYNQMQPTIANDTNIKHKMQ
jgi:hypothetical protein